MTINYQQAKRIRKVGLMDLFADQLMYEKSIGKAIGKTISLKTQAKIKGFKEHFDPLNIAKKLTFGSSWGPALLGHLMGRDTKDIQYFSGRLKPIRDTSRKGNKITKLPEEGSDSQAMNSTLRKMYKLLANTHEQNIRMSELAKNREEENQINDEKRHKQLLKALGNLTGNKTAAKIEASKDDSEGFMGVLGNLVTKLKDWVKDFLDKFDFLSVLHKIFGGLKAFGTLLRFLTAPIFGFLMGPLLAVGSVLALAELLKFAVANVDNRNVVTPEEAKNILENAQYKSDLDKFGGEEKLRDIIINGPKKAAEILERGDETEIRDAGGREFLQKVKKQTNVTVPKTNLTKVESVPPRPDTTGGKNLQRAANWDKKFGDQYDMSGKPKIVDNSYDNAEMAKLKRQSDSGTAVPVVNESVGQDFIKKNDEVMTGRVAYGKLQRSASIPQVNKTNVSSQNVKTTPLKRPVPSVRNQEEEFQSRMFENTVFLT
jgi:hypothetical protein